MTKILNKENNQLNETKKYFNYLRSDFTKPTGTLLFFTQYLETNSGWNSILKERNVRLWDKVKVNRTVYELIDKRTRH